MTMRRNWGEVSIIDEPALQFAHGQAAHDPHDGLALYGPYSLEAPSHPRTPPYAIIGARSGVEAFSRWASAMNRSWANPDSSTHMLWPPYPGFEVAFGSPWAASPAKAIALDRAKLLLATRKADVHERCYDVVKQYLSGFEKIRKLDTNVAVAICVVPDEVWTACRPQSYVSNPVDARITAAEKNARTAGQASLFNEYDTEQYHLAPDFRRQLKARAMAYSVPIQIIRESTLRLNDENEFGQRRLTSMSDRMWNLGTALYYKAGGKPWKLMTAREGVSYVGLAFRRGQNGGNTACCAAQMFLDSGDGIVFLGEYGPWYSEKRRQFHLSRNAAKKLVQGVLETYEQLDGRPLREVFIHSRSWIHHEEFEGFQEACPPGCKVVGIRVRADNSGPRLYRSGTRPVLRGTFLQQDARRGYLFASGFKPRIGTYDGWETPVPLQIDVLHGDASLPQVAGDILGLTKLNYNACRLGESQPVTVGFSDAVGEILVSNPTVLDRRPNFKFYI